MATMVLNRAVLPEPLLSCFSVPRIAMTYKSDGDVTLSPIIDPADYDNDTDYLSAIPGMVDKIIAASNAPASERVSRKELWGDV